MNRYCTLFNTNYLSRGLQMIRSLQSFAREAYVYVLAMDDECAKLLQHLRLKNVKVITLADLETPTLLQKKAERTIAEYCWTLTPVLIHHILHNYAIDAVTYVDADIMFYRDPSSIVRAMREDVVLLTPHRYTAKFDQSATSGIFCVQFMCFKRHPKAIKALQWWRDACLEWCYNRFEEGKFGDQKYLDNWPVQFKGIHICSDPAVGIAPWNIQQYTLKQEGKRSIIFHEDEAIQPIFYHFHGLKFFHNHRIELTHYPISEPLKRYFYQPYVKSLLEIEQNLHESAFGLNIHGKTHAQGDIKSFSKKLLGLGAKSVVAEEFACLN